MVEPRRRKRDEDLEYQLRLHSKAREYLERVERGEIQMIIPSIALIETASVIARLTNDEGLSKDAVDFLRGNSKEVLFDFETLETAIQIGTKTRGSGFDNLYLAVLELTAAVLLTDDLKLHNLAKRIGFESRLLRELT
ncbi:MAG: PIN domain-containing protein [Thaumarchaeota archaeon]|nr:PIN domain-containing protein [Nitrososphaerota archaeon]